MSFWCAFYGNWESLEGVPAFNNGTAFPISFPSLFFFSFLSCFLFRFFTCACSDPMFTRQYYS